MRRRLFLSFAAATAVVVFAQGANADSVYCATEAFQYYQNADGNMDCENSSGGNNNAAYASCEVQEDVNNGMSAAALYRYCVSGT